MMSARKHPNSQSLNCVATSANYGELLRRAILWIVDEKIFADLSRHGNTSWNPAKLVALSILWVWSDQSRLTDAFTDARRLSFNIFGEAALRSYQGLTEALVKWTGRLVPLLWCRLHSLMEQVGKDHWRIDAWFPLAVDGSRFSTPRTANNERAFACKNYGKGKMAKSRRNWKNKKKRSKPLGEKIKPQIWLTMIWHMGLKMPWSWMTGPSYASERDHLRTMIQRLKFPSKTLFCCDAGFTGYDLWDTILSNGHHLLIRVGSNVHLLRKVASVRCRNDYVYLWPKKVENKKVNPIVLRLITLRNELGTMYLVTSILDIRQLNNRSALQLYSHRWGVELQFRAVKQTFGRRKLRSRTADNALVELEWSLMGLWFIQLLAVKEQLKLDSPPERSSVATALRVIQDAMRSWERYATTTKELIQQLGQAVKDEYKRKSSKQSRYRPITPDKPCRSGPIIKIASPSQRTLFKKLQQAA